MGGIVLDSSSSNILDLNLVGEGFTFVGTVLVVKIDWMMGQGSILRAMQIKVQDW